MAGVFFDIDRDINPMPAGDEFDTDSRILALAAHVREKLIESRNAWQPEFRRMIDCIRMVRGIPITVPDGADDATDVISWPIVPSIVTALGASVRDVFGTAIGAPFTCVPSPKPDLPQSVQDWLHQRLMDNIPMLEQVTGGDPNKVSQAVDQLQAAAKEQIDQRASDTAQALDAYVKDRMFEGGWQRTFEEFLWNYIVYPLAIMKGPIPKGERTRHWNEDTQQLVFEDGTVLALENINPFSFYPAPNARDCQSCEYVIEVRRATALELALLSGVEGYNAESIAQVQEQYPDGKTEQFWTGSDLEPDRDSLQWAAPQTLRDKGFYDIVCFYGRIPGSLINDFEDMGLDEYQWYEAEIETVGDIVIRASLNNQPDGLRPFFSTSFEPIAGSVYGESVCTRLYEMQRVCEATVRDLMWNMSLSSGVGGEVDISRIDQNTPWDAFAANEIKPVKPAMAGGAGPAYTFHEVPNVAPQLREMLEYFKEQCYDIIGFTRVSLGGDAGSLGRTSSGMSIALNQSSKPLKLKVADLGSKIIVPVVQKYIDNILMTTDDPTIKGDIRVHPKGVDGLVDDETLSSNILQAMQTLGPVAAAIQQGSPVAPMLMGLYEKWAQLNNVPIPDTSNMALQTAFGQSTGTAYEANAASAQNGQVNPAAPPVPPMDNRATPALQALTAANNLPATTARGPGP